ncbi:MAG: AAA family ATPase [Spirochaetales bacterium]|nr:AAA family ATPase [Spirochaetales bacterium]
MRQIAFYGKGGIGKSTTTSNISAALSDLDFTIMQIGCDPKSDSTKNLTGGIYLNTILDTVHNNKNDREIKAEDFIIKGYNNVICCEAGGPEPGVGCAGRGVITAIQVLQDFDIFNRYNPDFVFFDVLGDVVCGGFAMPIRQGYAEEIYVITSGEIMSLFACNNIFKGIVKFAKTGVSRVGGIILNSRNTEKEVPILEEFARKTNTNLLHVIPRDNIVYKCEIEGKTVIEGAPDSDQAQCYRALAEKIIDNKRRDIPEPMQTPEFYDWIKQKGFGLVVMANE